MGRIQQQARRKPIFDDDESDDGAVPRSVQAPIDPKVAIQLADLGNSARDRQTAHDKEHDRAVNLAAINRTRRCNQEGTDEASKAAANQRQLTGWNTFGGDDATTNLDDIAGGQYHRQATSQKVQLEIRSLRLDGKDINAESIDARGRPARHEAPVPPAQRLVRTQNRGTPSSNSRPLDPAIEPNRDYRYKNGPQYGTNQSSSARELRGSRAGRGGRGAARGSHSMQLARGALTRSGDARNTVDATELSTPVRGKGLGGRAHGQRVRQDRPWPPMALMGNPVPLAMSSLISPVVAPSVQEDTLSQHTDVPKEAAPEPEPVAVDSQPARKTQPTLQPVLDTYHQQPSFAPQQSGSRSAPPEPSEQRKGGLAENFNDWYKGRTGQAAAVPTPLPAQTSPKPVNFTSISDSVAALPGGLRRQSVDEEHHTDGRLTPITFSDSSSEDGHSMPRASISREVTSELPSTTESGAYQILIDTDIPEDEQLALQVSVNQFTEQPRVSVNLMEGEAITAVPQGDIETTATPVGASVVESFIDVTNRSTAVHLDTQLGELSMLDEPALRSRSPNKAPVAKSSASKWASPTENMDVDMPETKVAIREASSSVSSVGRSFLGDCSNVRRAATGSRPARHGLSQSRFAGRPVKSSIERIQPGAGYEQLVRELEQKNIAVNQDRRPDESALASAPRKLGFLQYREPAKNALSSDEDEL